MNQPENPPEPHVDSHLINEWPGSSVKLLQLPPDNISVYWVQETELLMVAKGGDALALQIALTAAGAFVGALPGAFAAASEYNKDGKIDTPYLIALLIAVAGLIASVACGCIHKRQKTYPEKLLENILARKNA